MNLSLPQSLPCRVLLVDDQAMVGMGVRHLLGAAPDIQLLHCTDPVQALQVARTFQPTVLLLDVLMPVLDGFGLLERWRADPAHAEVPVVMLSVAEADEIKARAFALGANDYLIKLPRQAEFLARLRYHSRTLHLQRERDAALRDLRSAEAALRHHQSHLEQEVAQRTAALTSANQALARQHQALRQSEERLRTIIQNMPVLMFALDARGRFIVWNRECQRITGYDAETMVNNPDGLELLFPDAPYREQALASWTLPGEEEWEQEWQMTSRQGETRTVVVFNLASRFPIPGWAAWRVGVDISERQRLERQLRQAQKLEAIGTLAGGVAHDFNNILGVIIGYTELAMDDVDPLSPQHRHLQEVFKAGMRARDVVRQLLTFSRQSRPEPRSIDLATVVEEGIKFLRATLSPAILMESRVDAGVGTVMADPTQIHQVLLNLCTNAAQAIGEGSGRITVTLTGEILNRVEALPFGLESGEYVVLAVADTGSGIPAKFLDRIFDPFFTTKGVGEGTGLGLSLVHGIVMGHNGGIAVHSEPGHGSLFQVAFPLLDRTSPTPDVLHHDPSTLHRGEGRILLVDDEEAILQLMTRWLERMGYQVTACANPLEALSHFRQEPDAFTAVITDHFMPHLKGRELARKMLNVRPGLPIVLCTASTSMASDPAMLATWGFRTALQKPFQARALGEVLRQVLTTPSPPEPPHGHPPGD